MKIKNIIIACILLIAGSASTGYAQSSDLLRLMEGLEGKDGVTTVLVTKKMFQLFTKTTDIDMEGQSLNDVIGGLDELLVIEVGNWEPAAKGLKENISSIVKRDKFETLMKVVDKDEKVEIFVMEENNVIRHLFMFIENEDDSYQLISLKGVIDLEKISKLSGTLNIEGLKHLDDKKK
jgi:hypothetical protein